MANETQARDEVFARYDRGPDLDALNEPCKYDRYGFKLDPQVPYSTTNDNEVCSCSYWTNISKLQA